jgi:hypothetical protein
MLTHPSRQELYRLGILHDGASSNHNLEVSQQSPLFTIRTRKRRAPKRQRSIWVSLPLHLSLSSLSDDYQIKKLISTNTTTINTIQHRRPVPQIHIPVDPPQSLPAATPALGESHTSSAIISSIQSSYQDWEIINPSSQPPTPSTDGLSEPETWILLSDDS